MKSFTIPQERTNLQSLNPNQKFLAQLKILTQYACQVYPRVSTPEQKKNVSAEMQQDRKFALLCGWHDDDEMIIVEKDDLGLSGQLRMDERPAFVKTLRNISSGRVKTVVVSNISRFFRRKWLDEAEKFMQICDTYGVKVVVPNSTRSAVKSIFDFSQSDAIQQFRRECEEAWNYLENHIYGTMLAAEDILGQIGRWAGWNLPPGYIVDRRKELEDGKPNLTYRLYIPYPPHAEIVDKLHDRFWELGFNVSALLREIAYLECLFPAFEPWVDRQFINKLALAKVIDERGNIKGYTINSEHGLRSVLGNVAHIGYWVYKGELLFPDNHDPIVERNKFALTYNHLAPVQLDGTPNEFVLGRRTKYVKRHTPLYSGILDGKLYASDPDYRINSAPKPIKHKEKPLEIVSYYSFYKRRRNVSHASKYMIACVDLDRIFTLHFIHRLQQADEFENFLDAEKAELATQAQLVKDLDVQIDGAKKAMALKKAYLDSGKIKNLELLTSLDEGYTQLQLDLARLESQREKIVGSRTTAQKRRSYKQMMREAGDRWEEIIDPDLLLLMIEAFVEKMVIEPLSPQFYQMDIHWSDPEWGVDELLCYRDGKPSVRWSDDELIILYEKYENAPMEELFTLLPRRNYTSIMAQAETLGLKRRYQRCNDGLPKAFCLQDWEIMQLCHVTEEALLKSKGGRLITWAIRQERPHLESNR